MGPIHGEPIGRLVARVIVVAAHPEELGFGLLVLALPDAREDILDEVLVHDGLVLRRPPVAALPILVPDGHAVDTVAAVGVDPDLAVEGGNLERS